ncbi:MAG: ABC transporter permease, partial [Candidatus Paceibacterota bacterium]
TPFLYAGAIYGFIGGFVAISIISFSVNRFNHYVLNLSDLYSNDLSLATFNLDLLVGIMLCAIVIGCVGAYFAVGRALSSMIASYQRH